MTKRTKTSDKIAALPITDAPSWPDALNYVKLTNALRHDIARIIVANASEAARSKLIERSNNLFYRARQERCGGAENIARMESLPDGWLPVSSGIYIILPAYDEHGGDRRTINVGAKNGRCEVVTSCMRTNPWEFAGEHSSELLADAMAFYTDERAHDDAVNALKHQVAMALKGQRTVGNFLRTYPDVVQHIPAETLNALCGPAPRATALAVGPKAVMCALAKVQGIERAECCEDAAKDATENDSNKGD